MRRRLFTVLSALSLLLCVATAVLWLRSAFVADVWVRQAGDVGHVIRSDRGQISYSRWSDLPLSDGGVRWETDEPGTILFGAHGWKGRLGFGSRCGKEFLAPAGAVPDGATFSPLVAWVSQWWAPHWALVAARPCFR